MLIQIIVLSFSLTLTLLFFLYGFNNYYLLIAARTYKAPLLPSPLAGNCPSVAIHLPIYNEKYVVGRLVAACARMAEAYGMDRVRIVVIDDSDDDTAEIVDEVIKAYLEKDYQIEVLRRGSRDGFKAGALQAALDQTEEQFIAIFDADFTPPPDFLLRTLPYFVHDADLGVIQTRWAHINGDYSLLTRAIAIGIDVHFLIEQAGRYMAGCFQNFNGSGGVLRKSALAEAGGWQSDTLAEDLDASYRIQFQGYRVLYLRDLLSPGEVPPTVPSFKKQQGRWACGSLRTAKKLLPRLMPDRKLSVKKRFQAFLHLTGYMVHPLMSASFVLTSMATLLRVNSFRMANLFFPAQNGGTPATLMAAIAVAPQFLLWGLLGMLILLCTVGAWIPPMVALRAQTFPLPRKLASFLILFLLGYGVSLNNTLEAGKALLTNRHWRFRRTPKYAIQHNQGDWQTKSYQVSLDYVCLLELLFAGLGLISIGYAIWSSNLGVLLILVPFTAAYAFIATFTILESRHERSA